MKVYVITEGEYSGHHICGVTLNKDFANEFVKLHSSEEWYTSFQVEEYDTDIIDMLSDGMKVYSVSSRNGIIESREGNSGDYAYWLDEVNDVTRNKRDNWYQAYVIAKDKEHAEKQAVDLFTKYQYRRKVDEAALMSETEKET